MYNRANRSFDNTYNRKSCSFKYKRHNCQKIVGKYGTDLQGQTI